MAHRPPMPFETACDRCVVGVAGPRSGVDDDVDGRQVMLVVSKRFANQALQVIATDRTTDDAGCNGKSQSGTGTAIGANEDCEQGIGETTRILVDAIEVRFVMETLRRSKRPGDGLQVTLRGEGGAVSAEGVRPSDAYDLWRGGERVLADRHASPCEHENREYVDGELCSADRCASW